MATDLITLRGITLTRFAGKHSQDMQVTVQGQGATAHATITAGDAIVLGAFLTAWGQRESLRQAEGE